MSFIDKDRTIQVTKAEIDQLILDSELIPTYIYNITDASLADNGDTANIFIEAVTNNQLATTGKRLMHCIRDDFYTPFVNSGLFNDNFTGIYGQGITAGSYLNSGTTIFSNQYYAIWGGRMWLRKTTGADNTPPNDFDLDNVGWAIVPYDNTFIYQERTFDIIYDYENDWIMEIKDWKNNKIAMYVTDKLRDYSRHTDWGNESIYNNTNLFCIMNNYRNSTTKALIYNNSNTGEIINNSNTGTIRNNSNVGAIYSNSNNGSIYNNSNTGAIYSNSNAGAIYSNSNAGAIYSNSNNGSISTNSNAGAIYSNSNNGSISTNSNLGYENNIGSIYYNSNNGIIYNNSNNGIIYNNSNNGTIYNNSNLGSIRDNNGINASANIEYNNNIGNIEANGNTVILNNRNNGSIYGNFGNINSTLVIQLNSNNGNIIGNKNNNLTGSISIRWNVNNGIIGNNAIVINRTTNVQDTQTNK